MYQCLQMLVFLIWIFSNLTSSNNIFANVEEDATISAEISPVPEEEIVTVLHNNKTPVFFAKANISIAADNYKGRIEFFGNTVAGKMTFKIINISRKDFGIYSYILDGSTLLGSSNLFVFGKPKQPKIAEITSPIISTTLILICTANSTTVPQNHNLSMIFNWKDNGVNISVTSKYNVTGSILSVKNLQRNDKDMNITCCASEHGGFTSETSEVYTVDPLYSPETVRINPSTRNYTITERGTVSDIICIADCKPSCSYQWKKDGEVTSRSSDSILSLSNVNRNDAGVYRCTARNSHGTKNSNGIYVHVLYSPESVRVNPSTTNYTIIERGTVSDITCIADCKPNCSYQWRKDGQDTLHGFREILSLRNVNRNDTGVYRCTARNDLGTMNSSGIYVHVLYGPGASVQLDPTNTTYSFIENTTVDINISCQADCNPKCTYRWNKVRSSSLVFGKVDRSKAGTYICEATNTVHSSEVSIKLIIKYPSRVLNIFSIRETAMEKVKIAIICMFDAVPIPMISWSKNNETTIPATNNYFNESVLTIDSATCGDTGNYMCTVDNHITKNSKDFKFLWIAVNCSPRLKFSQSNLKPVHVTTGQGLNISTAIIAYPLPNITWLFRDEPIEQNQNIVIEKINDFEILCFFSKKSMSKNDFGIYTVYADNVFGNISASFDVQAARKPDPVTDIFAVCLSSDSANISFTPGFNGGTKQTFSLTFSTSEKSQTIVIPITDNGEHVTYHISGLLSKTFYLFKIISTNKFGNTESTKKMCLTGEPQEIKYDSPIALIGSITGTLLCLIVIIILVLTALYLSRIKKKGKENNNGLRVESADNCEDEMRDNILYEPSELNFGRPDRSIENTEMNNYTYPVMDKLEKQEIRKRNETDIYATVKKKLQIETGAINSTVKKPKIKTADGTKPKQQFRNQKRKADMVFENYDIKTTENFSPEKETVKQKQKVAPPKAKIPLKKGELQYVDLVFTPSKSGKVFVIHGSEDRTNYVDIVFSRKAEQTPFENKNDNDERNKDI